MSWRDQVPEASRPFVVGKHPGGTYICLHGRQLTVCPQCCTAAVERQKALDAGKKIVVDWRGKIEG